MKLELEPQKEKSQKITREEWLLKATISLRPIFIDTAGVHIPEDVEVSTGFPSSKGISAKVKTIGQCWTRAASDAKVNQIFINPCLADSIKVLDVLVHELIHAADDCKSGHRGFFAKTARAVGLVGKLTSTDAGPELKAKLEDIVLNIGAFPHSALNASVGQKKQSTRLIKIGCSCGVIGRMSQGAIDAMEWECRVCGENVGEI